MTASELPYLLGSRICQLGFPTEPRREELKWAWVLMVLALGSLPACTPALSPWGPNPSYRRDPRLWQQEQSLRCHLRSVIYNGGIFLLGDPPYGMCRLLPLPKSSPDCTGGDHQSLCQELSKGQKELLAQRPELSWVSPARGHLEQRTWKSELNDSDIYGYSD